MHVCIIHPQSELRNRLAELLSSEGMQTESHADAPEAHLRGSNPPQALVVDATFLETPELFQQLTEAFPVVVVTREPQVSDAVLAIKLGAVNYLASPFHKIGDTVVEAIEERTLRLDENALGPPILGSSKEIRHLRTLVNKIAPTNTTVLLHGETGTGKDHFAKAIHQASRRADKQLVVMNCDLVPQDMQEVELFGAHTQKADATVSSGLVSEANHSTLLLNEVGELSSDAQARLLYLLEHGLIRQFGSENHHPIDIRIIATSSQKPNELTQSGRLREDLFHRLNQFNLHIPPLRERGTDPVVLGRSMLRSMADDVGKPNLRLKPNAERKLQRYPWPGNVRELENAIERAVLLADGSTVDAELLAIEEYVEKVRAPDLDESNASTLEDYFREFVAANEDHCTETELAARLGISRKSLWERRQKLGIPRKRTRIRAVHK